ncbi:MAG TPA: sigma-54 dependent transcriptional regulator, partial [Planctomycetota bacterium]|nr:sigma-54 dependent transcriptional regulator [Planctomycetota bacterium]
MTCIERGSTVQPGPRTAGAEPGAVHGHGEDILIVDDEEAIRWSLSGLLKERGFRVRSAGSVVEARRAIADQAPDVALVDLGLGDGSGLEVIKRLRELSPGSVGIVVTGQGSVKVAVEAMQAGAFDFVEKPASPERLFPILDRATQQSRLKREIAEVRSELRELGQTPLLGASKEMAGVRKAIEQVLPSKSTTVLILGESGTGKELVARAIHYGSARRKARFVAVNCAALSESLLEAELFGYEKGSFTGAAQGGKAGLFEVANKGTIFLDEIGEMQLAMQAKLLRVLQEKTIKRVGGVDDIPIDVRVVASTNRDLEKEVREGRFRLDLFYRLNVMPIRMPPLRERPSDVPLLAEYFLSEFAREFGKELRGFSDEAVEALQVYAYPGNVRELRNLIEHAAIVAPGPQIERHHLMIEQRRGTPTIGGIQLTLPDEKLETAARELVLYVLRVTHGNRRRTAERLGINRSTLYAKLKEFGI